MATVADILLKPFQHRTYREKVRIVFAGKPRPRLTNKMVQLSKGSPVQRAFDTSVYDTEPWLTGCDKEQSLFCWSCLLFVEQRGMWNSKKGFCDFMYFKDAVESHRKYIPHVEGILAYQKFLQHVSTPRNSKPPPAVSQENELIKRNRKLASRIVDVVCHVVTTEFPAHTETNDSKQLFVDDCYKIFNLLAAFHLSDQDVTNDAINLLKTSPSVLTDMVSAITSVLKDSIKRETRQSTYVSLVLNEHWNNDFKSKMSTVLRYVINGKVCERLVGFTNFNQFKTSQVIYDHVSKVVEEFDIGEKFVAYACDGGVLASSYHYHLTLKTKLRDDYPFCLFVPCHFHKLDLVLEQSLSKMKACNLFFKNVNSIKAFFHGNSKAIEALKKFMNGSVPGFDSSDLSNSKCLRVLKYHRKLFIRFFKSIVDNFESWEAEDLPKALAFQKILQEFDTIFLLEAFSKVFDYTSKLNEILSSIIPEAVFGSTLPEDLKRSLEIEREESAFEKLWIDVVSEILEAQEPKPKSLKLAMEPARKLLHREFYLKIIDCVNQEIDNRFGSFKELLFFHFLNCEKQGNFVFANEALQSLLVVYGPYFHETLLKNEMKVLCSNSVFFRKTIYELMELFISANLNDTFVHLFKLAELTLTMPFKPPSATAGQSKLDKINAWSYDLENEESPTDFSFLCIEAEFLEEIKNGADFLKDVFTKFLELNKTVHLVL